PRCECDGLRAFEPEMPSEIPTAGQKIIKREADAQSELVCSERRAARRLVDRHYKRKLACEVRREPLKDRALVERLANKTQLEMLEIAKASVDELRRSRACAARKVALLNQSDSKTAACGVQRNPGPGYAAADHRNVELLARHSVQVRPA